MRILGDKIIHVLGSWGWEGKKIEVPGTSLCRSLNATLGYPATLSLELQVPSLRCDSNYIHCLQDIMKKEGRHRGKSQGLFSLEYMAMSSNEDVFTVNEKTGLHPY